MVIGSAWIHGVPSTPTPAASAAWTSVPSPSVTPTLPATMTLLPSRTATVARPATVRPSPQPTRVASPTPTVPVPLPTRGTGTSTEDRLRAAEMPQRDLRLLAERLKGIGPIPQVVSATPHVYRLGDSAGFWVGNVDTMEQSWVTATLRYVTPHLYVWVERGLSYDQAGLAHSAEQFEAHTYVTNRAFFGSEWSPGVDSDVHLHILHSTGRHMGDSVAGYYSSADEYSHLANSYSNEREMFYVALDGMMFPGTDFYDGVLAHEFQHMIHWANDRNEQTWVNEGCSELAAYLNGYDAGGFEWLFVADPDVQLTDWAGQGEAGPHYGSSYLFMAYFLGRFGETALKSVIAQPADGIAGFDVVLKDYRLTFEDVFADWLVANYLDNVSWANPEYGTRYTYPDHVVGPVALDITHADYPVTRRSTVHQYAADYVRLEGNLDLSIEFTGTTQAQLVPVDAHSGRYAWWSNRGDDSDATLTRALDLRSVDKATLQVSMWYDIEQDWDYAYVEVSGDGGQLWAILPGPSTTTHNPNGNSLGPAYTGSSTGWVEEIFDLTPYAGRQVLVRFEYVTDDAVNQAGWLIDDVRIPEIGYAEDLESGPGGWESQGFVYSDNRVSQRYMVQVIAVGRETQVWRMPLDAMQRGQVDLRGLGEQFDYAVLVVSAFAPVTTEIAPYEYAIRPSQRQTPPSASSMPGLAAMQWMEP